jgi:DNA-directed RNA polymerase subunit RPC12/RpoP
MVVEKQRYRVTFKCGECNHVFRKLTVNPNLKSAACPECKTAKPKTKFFKIGDGPVPSTEKKAAGFETPKVFPNTIYKCKDCSAVTKIFEDVGETALSECPACGSKEIQFRGKISHDVCTDSKVKTQAIDMTANIVMEDHKLGDLKDNVRMGETMAPKLAPGAQAMADSFASGGKSKDGQMRVYDANTRQIRTIPARKNMAGIVKRAMAGGMRDPSSYRDPVAMVQPAYDRLKRVSIVAGDGVGKGTAH